MNLVDVVIVVVVALGVYLGWSRGLIGPLIAEATFLITFWIISSHPGLVVSLAPKGIPAPLAILGVPILIGLLVGIAGRTLLGTAFRLPLARQVDKLLGAALHGALAVAVLYVALVAAAGADRVLSPISAAASIGTPQVAAMRSLLSQYPQAGGFVSAGELGQLNAVAAVHPVPFEQLGQYAQLISWYERVLRPQLSTSQLAPVVMKAGSHIPLIGGLSGFTR